jgi:hypothetical protein
VAVIVDEVGVMVKFKELEVIVLPEPTRPMIKSIVPKPA